MVQKWLKQSKSGKCQSYLIKDHTQVVLSNKLWVNAKAVIKFRTQLLQHYTYLMQKYKLTTKIPNKQVQIFSHHNPHKSKAHLTTHQKNA